MARVVHFEIPADDPERCARFYADALGWKVDQWGGPTEYWLVITGEDGPGIDGGIGRRSGPADQVTNTVDVASLDNALERVVAAGGVITNPKHAVPGVGWLAYCTDTEGNPFGLMQADSNAA